MTDPDNLWSLALEKGVLGVLLDGRHKGAWDAISQHCLHPLYFFHREHQLIVLVCYALAERGEPIDSLAVINECQRTVYKDAFTTLQHVRMLDESDQSVPRRFIRLPPPTDGLSYDDSLLVAIGGMDAVSSLVEALAPAGSVERNARKVADYYRLRKASKLVATSLATLQSPKGVSSLESVGGSLLEGISSILSGGNSRGRDLGECLESAVAAGQQHQDNHARGIARSATWGIPQLDALCPLLPGGMYVLSAPPMDGKTSLALQAASSSAAVGGKGSVSMCSLEMPGEQLAIILAAQELGMAPESIRNWTPAAQTRENEIRRLIAEWKAASSLMVRDLATGGQKQTAASIVAWFRQRKTATADRQALAVVDYLGLINGERDGAREYDTLTHATRSMKMAALSLSVPILMLCQLRREGRDEIRNGQGEITKKPEPRLSDLRGSGSIEQDADAVVFLHFPDRKKGDLVTRGKIIVAKQRSGPTGTIEVDFHLRHQRIVYAGLPSELDELPARPGDNRMGNEPSDQEDLWAQ